MSSNDHSLRSTNNVALDDQQTTLDASTALDASAKDAIVHTESKHSEVIAADSQNKTSDISSTTNNEVTPSSAPNDEKALRLGHEKVSSLLWKFSLPAIAAMVVSSLYNIIAGIFIGHLGTDALSGVGLCAPFMNLAAAFGALIGVGGSVLCSISLGEKDYPKARKILANVVILNVVIGILLTIVGLIYLDPILVFLSASEKTIGPAREYMQIILIGNVFSHLYLGLNSVLRISGSPIAAMNIAFLSVGVNFILAPIFIFWFGWGVRGAAMATVIAELFCCVTVCYIFSRKTRPIYFERDKFRLDWPIVKRSFQIGSPNFFTNAAACVIVIIQNNNLKYYGDLLGENVGDLYIGGFSIVTRIGFFFFMIVLGFSQGMQPIVAYNYGAKQYDRMWQAFKLTLVCALTITILGTLCSELIPNTMASIFVDESKERASQMIEITADAFKKYNAFFWIIAVQVIGSNFFASMNQPGKSLFLALTRQVIFIIPLLLILPPLIGIDGVWYTAPISDAAAALCAVVLLILEYKKQSKILTKA